MRVPKIPFDTEIDRVKGSRFIGYVQRVDSVEEADAFVESIRRLHRKATHVVWAHRHDATIRRSSDDGEPNGTAGPPVLARIDGSGLDRVAVAVVRYYGGTNLGKGGLVRSYGAGAGAALDGVEVLEIEERDRLAFDVRTDCGSRCQRVVQQAGFVVEHVEWGARVRFVVHGPTSDRTSVVAALEDAARGDLELAITPG